MERMIRMKTMKKLSALTMAIVMSIGTAAVTASAEETTEESSTLPTSVTAYVTIADGEGKLAVEQKAVEVTDTDNDGALTIADALYAAHEDYYEGGAAAGFATAETQWGLSLAKLWGVENGGSYGYYVNGASAWALTDSVVSENGAPVFVDAFVYTDTSAFSDTYCYFDTRFTELVLDENDTIDLTLSYAGYDADWNPVTLPAKGAYITINGEKTDFVTDDEGKVTVKLDKGGDYVISAVSDTQTLVPPICVVSALKQDEEEQVEPKPEEEPEVEPEEEPTDEPEEETEEPTEDEESEEEEDTKAEEKKDTAAAATTTSNPKTSSELQLALAGLALAGIVAAKSRKR